MTKVNKDYLIKRDKNVYEVIIGLEVHAQAFAYKTNDALSDMTFYSYKIINRSTETLNDTYFGQWVDPDVGNYQDDYVGRDVDLGRGAVEVLHVRAGPQERGVRLQPFAPEVRLDVPLAGEMFGCWVVLQGVLGDAHGREDEVLQARGRLVGLCA